MVNTKHPRLGYTQSKNQQKQPVEFDGFGVLAVFAGLCTLPNPPKSSKDFSVKLIMISVFQKNNSEIMAELFFRKEFSFPDSTMTQHI